MIQSEAYYKRLLLGYISNSISTQEVKELFDFIQQEPEQYALLMDEPEVLFQVKHQIETFSSGVPAEVEHRFQRKIDKAAEYAQTNANVLKTPSLHPRRFLHGTWFRYAAAAIIVICIGVALYFRSASNGTGQAHTNGNNKLIADVAPGKNGAVLTLANGSAIVLDSLGNGVVTNQGETTLLIRNSQLVYNAANMQQEALYNTTTTPNGRQFSLVLADGSQVWLNAGSSITYPTIFTGNKRSVTITGEVYFEVSKDKAKPFHVKVNDMDVEVLGTHFNINSYADEGDIKTTLLEGKIKISKNGKYSLLKPGQQVIANDQQLTVVNTADLQQVTAWKNGLFNFDHSSLKTVMQQLARWYDIQVKYEGNVPSRIFRGKITRDLYLSQVLDILTDVGVKFRIEGKTVIVTH